MTLLFDRSNNIDCPADSTSHANFDLDKPIPWLLAAKNGNRLQHRTMFRASNVKNAFSYTHYFGCIGANSWPTTNHAHCRRRRRRYRCRRATVFGNQMIFAARVPLRCQFSATTASPSAGGTASSSSRESGMMPGARVVGCRCTEPEVFQTKRITVGVRAGVTSYDVL